MQYTIRIHRNAQIIQQSNGEFHTAGRPMIVKATQDAESGCMLFRMAVWGVCYVFEDYDVINEAPNA